MKRNVLDFLLVVKNLVMFCLHLSLDKAQGKETQGLDSSHKHQSQTLPCVQVSWEFSQKKKHSAPKNSQQRLSTQ